MYRKYLYLLLIYLYSGGFMTCANRNSPTSHGVIPYRMVYIQNKRLKLGVNELVSGRDTCRGIRTVVCAQEDRVKTAFKGACLYNASILTLQQKILSDVAHVRTLKTRIRIGFSCKHPYRDE